MPRGDGTGPRGMGPMTGRAGGYCAGFDAPGYANPVPGRGAGAGFGRGAEYGRGGRGWRHWYHATGLPGWARAGFAAPWGAPGPEEEKEALKARADELQSELENIKKRLEKIGTGDK